MTDLSKFQFDSRQGAFANNNIYTGSFTISGFWVPGYQVQTSPAIPLLETPDMVVATFQAPTDTVYGSDPRPNTAWFKDGYAWVRGDNAGAGYTNYPINFKLSMRVVGNNAYIDCSTVNQTATTLTLTATTVYYRIIDYSVL